MILSQLGDNRRCVCMSATKDLRGETGWLTPCCRSYSSFFSWFESHHVAGGTSAVCVTIVFFLLFQSSGQIRWRPATGVTPHMHFLFSKSRCRTGGSGVQRLCSSDSVSSGMWRFCFPCSFNTHPRWPFPSSLLLGGLSRCLTGLSVLLSCSS